MVQRVEYNDVILLVSLLYSCVDLRFEWEMFEHCSKPVHHWLIVSYGCVVVFRFTHFLGSRAAAKSGGGAEELGGSMGDFLLDLRHKGAFPRALAGFTWFIALPFFLLWTMIGTAWFWRVYQDTYECIPSITHIWFSAFWLVLCYAWVLTHVAFGVIACVLEGRVRRAEGDLREIEDEDTLQRWGQVSQISGYQDLADAGALAAGMPPAEIKKLPSESSIGSQDSPRSGAECPICLHEIKEGDILRRLPGCGHAFHRSCIDLWLLRRADCPLCKHSLVELKKRGGVLTP